MSKKESRYTTIAIKRETKDNLGNLLPKGMSWELFFRYIHKTIIFEPKLLITFIDEWKSDRKSLYKQLGVDYGKLHKKYKTDRLVT